MATTVEQIKERLNIADVIGSYITLQKAGKNFKAKCPFHNEKTPSFFVNPERGGYYCFGCGAKGDIFTFVEEYERLDFPGALKVLADRAGVQIVREGKAAREKTTKLYELLEVATGYFSDKLSENQKALEYLKSRGLKDEAIKRWRLGFAPAAWRDTSVFLKKKGFSELELLRGGMVKKSEEGGNMYDRFRSRIMFPIADVSGRVVGFSGRIFGSDKTDEAKYLNSPETELFRKSSVLYGLDKAKQAIRKNNFGIVVEGQMDVILSSEAGYPNSVAASGTALTEDHLKILKRYADRLVFAFDADKAGVAAALKSTKIALALGFEVKVAATPEGSDPADIAGKDSTAWKKCVAGSKHVIYYVLDRVKSSNLSGRALAEEIKITVLPFIASVENRIEQSDFVKVVSEELGVREEAVWDELKKIKTEKRAETAAVSAKGAALFDRENSPLRHLFGILYLDESRKGNGALAETIRKELRQIFGERQADDLAKKFSSSRDELILRAETEYESKEKMEDGARELLFEVTRDLLRENFAGAMKALSIAEKNRDEKEAIKELKRCQEISARLNRLNVRK